MTTLFIIKFDSGQMKIVGGVAFWNFFLPYPMLTKTKNKKNKIAKIWKLEKRKKNGLEIWWIGSGPQNFWPGSMQQFLRNLSLQMDDRHLHHDSGSADKVNQS